MDYYGAALAAKLTGIPKPSGSSDAGKVPIVNSSGTGYQLTELGPSLSYEVVTELPSTGENGVIYLISNGGTGTNVYDEYIWTGSGYEKIGTTEQPSELFVCTFTKSGNNITCDKTGAEILAAYAAHKEVIGLATSNMSTGAPSGVGNIVLRLSSTGVTNAQRLVFSGDLYMQGDSQAPTKYGIFFMIGVFVLSVVNWSAVYYDLSNFQSAITSTNKLYGGFVNTYGLSQYIGTVQFDATNLYTTTSFSTTMVGDNFISNSQEHGICFILEQDSTTKAFAYWRSDGVDGLKSAITLLYNGEVRTCYAQFTWFQLVGYRIRFYSTVDSTTPINPFTASKLVTLPSALVDNKIPCFANGNWGVSDYIDVSLTGDTLPKLLTVKKGNGGTDSVYIYGAPDKISSISINRSDGSIGFSLSINTTNDVFEASVPLANVVTLVFDDYPEINLATMTAFQSWLTSAIQAQGTIVKASETEDCSYFIADLGEVYGNLGQNISGAFSDGTNVMVVQFTNVGATLQGTPVQIAGVIAMDYAITGVGSFHLSANIIFTATEVSVFGYAIAV